MSINSVSLVGRTVREPDIRSTQSGKQVAMVTIAVDRNFKSANGDRETDFIPLVIWGKLSEVVDKYVTKGKQIGVTGRLQVRNYEDKDGKRVYITEVIVNDLQLLGSRQDGQAQEMSGFTPVDEGEDDTLPF
mgnify:CR=1 FL=1